MERSKHFAGIASFRVLTSGIGVGLTSSATAVNLVFTGAACVRDVVVIMVQGGEKGGRSVQSVPCRYSSFCTKTRPGGRRKICSLMYTSLSSKHSTYVSTSQRKPCVQDTASRP